MEFKEVFERYQYGKVTEEEREFVEKEIDKFILIEEYLGKNDIVEETAEVKEEAKIKYKKINKSLWKRNAVIVVVTLAIIVVGIGMNQYVITPFRNSLYFNPAKKSVSKQKSDFELFLGAYTNINCQGKELTDMTFENTGVGEYTVKCNMLDRYDEGTTEIIEVNKDDVTIPYNIISGSNSNRFTRGAYPYKQVSEKILKDGKKSLEMYEDSTIMEVAVSFAEDIPMDQILEIVNNHQYESNEVLWVGVRNTEKEQEAKRPLVGIAVSENSVSDINDVYPNFNYFDSFSNRKFTEDVLKNHLISQLQFQLDHSEFFTYLGDKEKQEQYYQKTLDYVKEHGIRSYGMIIKAKPEKILEMCENYNIEDINIIGYIGFDGDDMELDIRVNTGE